MKTRLPSPRSISLALHATRGLLLIAAAVVFMSAGASCVSKPTMKVDHARVTGVGPLGIGVDVAVRVYNGNGFDIMIRNMHAQTTLAGLYRLPPVDIQPNIWLPSKETTFVTTPLVIPWALVPGVLATTLGNEYISYHVQGYADVSATRALGVQVNNEPLDERGNIPRQVMLRAARTAIPGAL